MAERKLGVGVVGALAWAEKAHLPGYAHYDRCRKVAICDIIPERARHLADMFGFETTYDSVDANAGRSGHRNGRHLHPHRHPSRT